MNDKKDQAARRLWLWQLAALWIAAAAWLIFQKWALIKGLSLPDTDDNLRLQQVRDWLAGQPWFDLRQHRMLPPHGADIHWSRLVDIPLAGLILLLKPFLPMFTVERAAVTIAPLLPLGVIIASLAFITRRLIEPKAWFVAPVLLMFAYSTLAMVSPLRIDHHGWQLALMMVMISGLVAERRALGGAISGAILGLSLAIGIELLPYLGLIAAITGLFWVADRGEAPRIAAFGASAAGVTALSLVLFVPPPARLLGFCDALSIAHVQALALGGAGLVLLAALPIGRWPARLVALLALGAAVAAATWVSYPQCLGDPSALIDPDARRLWLANVREARPIYLQARAVIVNGLALPCLGLLGVGLAIWQSRPNPERLRKWLAVGLLALFAVAFSFFQTRATPAAQLLSLAGAAMLAWEMIALSRQYLPYPYSSLGVAGAFLLVSGLGIQLIERSLPEKKIGARVTNARVQNQRCATLGSLRPLNSIPAATMFTFMDLSPRLIVATHHSAIIGPYHRNGKAIADVMKAFGGTADEARIIVHRYNADYVVICPGVGEATIYARRAPKGFYSELAAGRAPGWLRRVPLGGDTPYMLWKVADR